MDEERKMTRQDIGARGRRALSPEDFVSLGLDQLAYVKPIVVEGRQVFEMHAADGSMLAVFADRDSAIAAARRNDFAPVSVH